MSSGQRITFKVAQSIAAYVEKTLLEMAIDEAEQHAVGMLQDVGSLRRKKESIGDLEVLAPLPTPREPIDGSRPEIGWDDDPLFRVLNRIVDNPVSEPKKVAAVLWMQPREELEKLAPKRRELGTAIKGLKPGFLAASIMLRVKKDVCGVGEVKLEIFRAARDNWGWALVMRTGPQEFGIEFLTRWKRRYGIPLGDGGKASVDGGLVDSQGTPVPTPTEEDAFRLCGMEFIQPERRDWFVEHLRG